MYATLIFLLPQRIYTVVSFFLLSFFLSNYFLLSESQNGIKGNIIAGGFYHKETSFISVYLSGMRR
jgi:hypothetical protein